MPSLTNVPKVSGHGCDTRRRSGVRAPGTSARRMREGTGTNGRPTRHARELLPLRAEPVPPVLAPLPEIGEEFDVLSEELLRGVRN